MSYGTRAEDFDQNSYLGVGDGVLLLKVVKIQYMYMYAVKYLVTNYKDADTEMLKFFKTADPVAELNLSIN
jgi:hypothetical protein